MVPRDSMPMQLPSHPKLIPDAFNHRKVQNPESPEQEIESSGPVVKVRSEL